MNLRNVCAAALTLGLLLASAAALDEPPYQGPLAITKLTVDWPDREALENATILIVDGRIVDVGQEVALPPGTRVIDGSGKFAYAGFIDALSRTGVDFGKLEEKDERRIEGAFPSISETPQVETVEANRRGIFASRRVEDALYIEDDTFDGARRSGFTLAQIAPPRALLGGRTAMVSLGTQPVRRSIIAAGGLPTASFETPPRRNLQERGGYPATPLGVVAHLRQVFSDARWYLRMKAHVEQNPDARSALPFDRDLEALGAVLTHAMPIIWEAENTDAIQRVLDLTEEFGTPRVAIAGGREAYKVIERLKARHVPVIVSLKLPAEVHKYKIDGKKLIGADDDGTFFGAEWNKRAFYPERAYEAAEQERQRVLENPQKLEEAGVAWCFSTSGLKKPSDAFENLQAFIDAGLSADAALKALTVTPLRIFSGKEQLGGGGLQAGARANVTILSAALGEKDAKVTRVIVDGRDFEFHMKKPKGKKGEEEDADEEDEEADPDESEQADESEDKAATGEDEVTPEEDEVVATGVDRLKIHAPDWAIETDADRVAAIRSGGSVLLQNATVLTISGDDLPHTSVLIEDGKITRIGKKIEAPTNVRRIDLTGYVIMPGMIDPHSHMASYAVNEWSMSVTPEVRIADVVRSTDPGMYWALSGGTTTIHTMHGSANTIGGQNVILKLKYGKPARELIVPEQVRTVKFALGENVKRPGMRSRMFNRDAPRRFPGTRMGVEATMRRALDRGRAYADQRTEYREQLAASGAPAVAPLRRDLRLEALADIVEGDIWVNCHCYRADEILRLLAVAEDFGFRISALHHVLEGYRIMPEIARHGCGTATFADWWAYKIEAYEAVPHNAGMMLKYGIDSTLKSDSPDLARHLNQEAAKAMKYAGLTPNEALRLVTLNAARLFGLEDRLGTIDVGKDGDIAVFDGHPLDSFSKCVMTLVEGEIYFTHPEFNPELRQSPGRPIKHFTLNTSVDFDPRKHGKTPLTVNPRDPAADAALVASVTDASDGATAGLYAIVDATIHPISGPPIQSGAIMIRDGKIEALGARLHIPSTYKVIDGTGLHVWPGLINAGTTVGMTEIGQVSVTVDTAESGTYQPDVTAVSAVNPHSAMIGVTRAEGVTTALVLPGGARVAGQAGLVDLAGWTMNEMLIDPKLGLVVTLPSKPAEGLVEPERESKKEDKEDDDSDEALLEIERFFRSAKLYAEAVNAGADDRTASVKRDLRYEALIPYVSGERPVLFNASGYKAILEALLFADRLELQPVILGGRDAWKVADVLAERDVPVIYQGSASLPSRLRGAGNATDAWDSNYRGLAELHQAGVRFCISYRGADLAKNLAVSVGLAIAHGLDPEAAVRALTLSAAEILGVDDRLGSLEPGKVANIIVTTDNPCQATNVVKHVLIRGEPVSLATKHTRNAAKFANRPEPALLPERTDLRGPASKTTR